MCNPRFFFFFCSSNMAFRSVSLPCVVVFSLLTLVQCKTIDLYGCRLSGNPTNKQLIEFQKCVATNSVIYAGNSSRWGRSLRHQEFFHILEACPLDAQPDDFAKCVRQVQSQDDMPQDLEQQVRPSTGNIMNVLGRILENEKVKLQESWETELFNSGKRNIAKGKLYGMLIDIVSWNSWTALGW